MLAEIRSHKPELIRLLDGSMCRHCRQRLNWQGMTAIALADGTSLHDACREAFEIDRINRSAEAAVHPVLAADPGEVVLHGELAATEQEPSSSSRPAGPSWRLEDKWGRRVGSRQR